MEIAPTLKECVPLKKYFSFYVPETKHPTIQADYGRRSMFRKNHAGESGWEKGGTLVYSFGPTGHVATILYPCTSNMHAVAEDHIILRLGQYTAYELKGYLKRDLNDLNTYTTVTSLDAKSSFRQLLRVWWLRKTRPVSIDGKPHERIVWSYFGGAVEMAIRVILMTLLKPWGIFLAASIAAYFGIQGFGIP